MNCDKLPLEQLASGELPLPARLLLHWHRIRCPSCRVAYLQTQDIRSQLRSIAEEPVSDTLRQKVLAALPESATRSGYTGNEGKVRPKMTRLAYIILCATLVLAVTGALATKFLFRPSFGCSDRLGRSWHITGDFHGRIEILDSKGTLAAIFDNGFGEMKEAVEVTSSGETVTVQGTGRHEIRGKDGTLFGYIVFRPRSEKEYLAARGLTLMPTLNEEFDRQAQDWANPNWDTHGGASGIESAPWGVRGFDSASGLRWRMYGTGELQIVDGTGKKVLASAHTVPARMPIPASLRQYAEAGEPDLLVTYGKRTWKKSGYGTHKLQDDVGDVLLIIEALPAAR